TDSWRKEVRASLRSRKALEALAQRPEAQHQPLASLLLLANALQERGGHSAAISLLRPVQQRQPGDFWVNYRLGLALMDVKPPQLGDAVVFNHVAVGLRPHNGLVRVNLGYALQMKKDYAGALAVYDKALELEPNYAPTHNNIGVILMTQGDLPGAIAKFQKAIGCAESAEAYSNLGAALDQQSKPAEALQNLDKATTLAPRSASPHLNRGHALHSLKKLDEAIDAYETAIACDEDLASAYSGLGIALNDKGDFANALAQHRKAIALDRDEPR